MPGPMSPEDLEELVDDMLLNSEARLRGAPGVGDLAGRGAVELYARGYVGPLGTLTRKGVERALKLQREHGWI